jgi:hypothetical protein
MKKTSFVREFYNLDRQQKTKRDLPSLALHNHPGTRLHQYFSEFRTERKSLKQNLSSQTLLHHDSSYSSIPANIKTHLKKH